MLNRFFADKYKGKYILRFDDTNPSKEEGEFEDAIKEDLAMIEVAFDKVVHTSDHFDKIEQFTEQLIKQGDAYMDDTDAEEVGNLSFVELGLPSRSRSVAARASRRCAATSRSRTTSSASRRWSPARPRARSGRSVPRLTMSTRTAPCVTPSFTVTSRARTTSLGGFMALPHGLRS